MLRLIISVFIVNWLPIHVFNFYTFYLYLNGGFKDESYSDHSENNNNTFTQIYYICQWLSMSSTFVNPICYSFMNKYFKVFLKL